MHNFFAVKEFSWFTRRFFTVRRDGEQPDGRFAVNSKGLSELIEDKIFLFFIAFRISFLSDPDIFVFSGCRHWGYHPSVTRLHDKTPPASVTF